MEEKIVGHFTDSIYYELEKTSRVLRLLGIQVFDQINAVVTPDEHAALDTILCNPNICQRDLARLILKDRANTGRILNSLEEKGMITRCIDLKNNRLVKKVTTTKKGEITINEISEKLEILFNEHRMSCKISRDEIDNIQKSIKKLRKSFEGLINVKI